MHWDALMTHYKELEMLMWIPEGSLNWWGWMNIPGELVLISCYIVVLTSFVFNISLTVSSSSLFNFLFLSSVHITFGLWSLTSLSFNVIFLILHSPFPFLFLLLAFSFLSSSLYFPFLISLFFSNSFILSKFIYFPHCFLVLFIASSSFFFPLFPSSVLPLSFPGLSLLCFPSLFIFLFFCFLFSFPFYSFPFTFLPFSFLLWFFFFLYLFPYLNPPPTLLLGIQECAPQREPLRGAPSLSP